jgi:hypothetical protein
MDSDMENDENDVGEEVDIFADPFDGKRLEDQAAKRAAKVAHRFNPIKKAERVFRF